MTDLVQLEVDRGIAVVTLRSPDTGNSMSPDMVSQLSTILRSVKSDLGVRAAVITHAGDTFCAGVDRDEQAANGGMLGSAERFLTFLRLIVEMPKPVVARVDGRVRGGGLGLVAACDIVLASSASTFAFTEVRMGLVPAITSLTALDRMTERAMARYCMTGETFDADAAARSGLITEAVDDIDVAVDALLDELRLCTPPSFAQTKMLATREVRIAMDTHGADLVRMEARGPERPDPFAAVGALVQRA